VRPAPGWRAAVPLAVLAGCLVAVTFRDFRFWALSWFAFVPLLMAIEGASAGRGFACGWIAGLTTHLVGFTWFTGLLVRFAHFPLPAAIAVYILYCAWGGVAWGLVCAFTARLCAGRGGFAPVLVLPASLVAVEFAFPHVFPWNLAGGQCLFIPFAQAAEVVGVLGLGGVIAAAGAAAYELVAARFIARARKPRRILACAVLLLTGLLIAWGAVRVRAVERTRAASPLIRVGVVQPNVPMDEKGARALAKNQLSLLQDLSAAAVQGGAELVIWPESAYPYRIQRQVRTDLRGRKRILRGFEAPVLFGAVSFDATGRYNSAFLLSASGSLSGPVDKNHLVMFSERIPMRDHVPTFIRKRYPVMTAIGFSPGAGPGVLEIGGTRAGILVCFEDTMAGFARRVVRAGANVLVNVTNDAWFGDTVEPHQHLGLAVFRAVENRRDLVRSVNTGVSGVIEATGRIAYRTGTFEEAVFVSDVRLLDLTTPFTRMGGWPGWVALAALVLLGLAATIRRQRSGKSDGPRGFDPQGGGP